MREQEWVYIDLWEGLCVIVNGISTIVLKLRYGTED